MANVIRGSGSGNGNIKKSLCSKEYVEMNGGGGNSNYNSVFNIKDCNNKCQFGLAYSKTNEKLVFMRDDANRYEDHIMTLDRNDGLVSIHNDLLVNNNVKFNGKLDVDSDVFFKGRLHLNGALCLPNNTSEAFQGSMLKTGLESGVLIESVKFVHYLCEGFLEVELVNELPDCYKDCGDMVMFDYFIGPNAHVINGKAFTLRFKESCGPCEDDKPEVNRKIIFVPTRDLGGVSSGIDVQSRENESMSQTSVYRVRNYDEYAHNDTKAGLSFFYANNDRSVESSSHQKIEIGNNNTSLMNRTNKQSIFGRSEATKLEERSIKYSVKNDVWNITGSVNIDSMNELQVSKIVNKSNGSNSKGVITIDGSTRINEDLELDGDLNLDGNINSNNDSFTIGLSDNKSYINLNNDNTIVKSDGDLTLDVEDDINVKCNNLDLGDLHGYIKLNDDTAILFGTTYTSASIDCQTSVLSINDNSESHKENDDNDNDNDIGLKLTSKNRDILLHPQTDNKSDDNGSVIVKGDLQCINFYAQGTFNHSDISLKYDVNNMSNSEVDKLMKLRPVSYKWKNTDKNDFGFIAQDIELEFPEFVSTNSSGIKSVDYAKLVSILTKCVQIQEKRINELTNIVNKHSQ